MKKIISIVLAVVLIFSALALTFSIIFKDELKGLDNQPESDIVAPEDSGQSTMVSLVRKTYNGDLDAVLFGVKKESSTENATFTLVWDENSALKENNVYDYLSFDLEHCSQDEVLVVLEKDFGSNYIYLEVETESGAKDAKRLEIGYFLSSVKIDTTALTLDENNRFMLNTSSNYTLPLIYSGDNYDGRFTYKTVISGHLIFECLGDNMPFDPDYYLVDLSIVPVGVEGYSVSIDSSFMPACSIEDDNLNIAVDKFITNGEVFTKESILVLYTPDLVNPDITNPTDDFVEYLRLDDAFTGSGVEFTTTTSDIKAYNESNLSKCYILVEVIDNYSMTSDVIKLWVNV